jgi:hypothetical protein
MVTKETGLYIPVSEVFPNIQSDLTTLKSLLEQLSLTDTLFWCARLNLVISGPAEINHKGRQQFGLDYFFTTDEIIRVNEFAKRHGEAEEITIFFRGQLLELMRWVLLYCNDHPNDGNTFELPEVRRIFAQSLLIASDMWARRVYGDRFSLDGGVETARQRSLGAIRKAIEATTRMPNLDRSLGRGLTLFSDYFPAHFEGFEQKFHSQTGFSVEEYYICLSAIMCNYMFPDINTGIFNANELGESTPYEDILQKYISLEAQTVDELRERLWGKISPDTISEENAPIFDYRPLREKPILKAYDGRAIILDPVFYSEKASVGPLFHLLSGVTSNKEANKIFGAFGSAFESYACGIMSRMFPDISSASNKRLTCNVPVVDATRVVSEIDACLNDIVETALFEIKAVFMPESKLLDNDYLNYVQILRKKYSVTQGCHSDRSVKGVGQLAQVIRLLADGVWLGPNNALSKARLVYPILLVHDSLMNAPVYGSFLASEFKAHLKPDMEFASGECKIKELRVAPLIIITIDDLENLETSIRFFGFRDLLADYSKAHPDRSTSLHNYIAFSEYKNKLRHSQNLAFKGQEILRQSQDAIFPGTR